MPRAQATDLMQGHRFQVVTNNSFGMEPTEPQGGFQNCSIPTISIDPVEYKEGTDTYTKKYPGAPTVGDVTLNKGIAKRSSAFYDWMMRVVNGDEYRAEVTIYQFPRDGKTNGVWDRNKARRIVCYEAFPTEMKPGGDLDATSADVSVAELTIACESIEQFLPSE